MVGFRRPIVRLVPPALVIVLFSGCATILTPIPPSEYGGLSGAHTLRVTTTNGERRETSQLDIEDSTLTIIKPRAAMHDPRTYPVSYRFSEIRSVASIKQESLVYVESGVETGKNHGAESQYYSETFLMIEMGYLSGERARPEPPRWGFGGTFLVAASNMDFRAGMKARARYRFNRHLSCDVTAGPMLTSWNDGLFNGFIGGVGVNLGSFFTLKSEYMLYGVPPWRESGYTYSDGYTYTNYPGGYEKVWYNGVAFRGTLGWVTASVGSVALIAFVVASFAALGSSN